MFFLVIPVCGDGLSSRWSCTNFVCFLLLLRELVPGSCLLVLPLPCEPHARSSIPFRTTYYVKRVPAKNRDLRNETCAEHPPRAARRLHRLAHSNLRKLVQSDLRRRTLLRREFCKHACRAPAQSNLCQAFAQSNTKSIVERLFCAQSLRGAT